MLPEGRLAQPAGGVAEGAAERAEAEGRQPPLHPARRPAQHEGAAPQGDPPSGEPSILLTLGTCFRSRVDYTWGTP